MQTKAGKILESLKASKERRNIKFIDEFSLYKVNLPEDTNRGDLTIWLQENTTEKFHILWNYVLFESEKEALFFKLKFGK